MLLIDFQVHTHQTQKYLHLICNERVFYFKAPCFGLVTAPRFTQVFSLSLGLGPFKGYSCPAALGTWLVPGSSRQCLLSDRDCLLAFCLNLEMEIVINWQSLISFPNSR